MGCWIVSGRNWNLVRSLESSVLSSQFSVLSSRFSVLSSQFSVLSLSGVFLIAISQSSARNFPPQGPPRREGNHFGFVGLGGSAVVFIFGLQGFLFAGAFGLTPKSQT